MAKSNRYFASYILIGAFLFLGNHSLNGQEGGRNLAEAQAIARDTQLVEEVKRYNMMRPSALASLNQQIWDKLHSDDEIVKTLSSNNAANVIKAAQALNSRINEIFVCGADGSKVAFLNKPSYWSHAGRPKHDDPMKGKPWIGKIEVDASTKRIQYQIGVPIVDDAKPIGSLIIGYDITTGK